MIEKTRLKPVVYTTNSFKWGAQNTAQQMFLLKALQVTSDPHELRKLIGVRTVAEVYRTLDKLTMRKEYHEALARSGISFDFIVSGLKKEAEEGDKSGDRMKSLGLDKYDNESATSGTWEEELLKSLNNKEKNLLPPADDYEVVEPEKPKRVKVAQEEERKTLKDIYE